MSLASTTLPITAVYRNEEEKQKTLRSAEGFSGDEEITIEFVAQA
jgi:hypothetical protein